MCAKSKADQVKQAMEDAAEQIVGYRLPVARRPRETWGNYGPHKGLPGGFEERLFAGALSVTFAITTIANHPADDLMPYLMPTGRGH